jgi:hypothetical protein
MSTRRKKPENDTAAQLKRITRGFYSSDSETKTRKISQAMEVLDPEQKIWRREIPTSLH